MDFGEGAPPAKKGVVMDSLTDESLVEVYVLATKYQLEEDFIELLFREMVKRGLSASVVNTEE